MWEIHIRERHLELHVIKWFIDLLIHLWVCQVILMTNSQILLTIENIKFEGMFPNFSQWRLGCK